VELYKDRISACKQARGVVEKSSTWDKKGPRIETNCNRIEKNNNGVKEDGLYLNVLNKCLRIFYLN
jgi:hypothetical protein